MIDAQIWYYDEMRKTDKAESGQTEIGGEIVNIAFEGNLEKFGGYGDSTVVNKKIGNEEGAIEYERNSGGSVFYGQAGVCPRGRKEDGNPESREGKARRGVV